MVWRRGRMRRGGIGPVRWLAPSLAKSAAMRQNVQQNVPWNLEGLDPDTRDAAREAARRAGMSLDEWLNVTISDRASRVFADTAGSQPAMRRRTTQSPSYDELDAIAAKISKVTRGRAASSSRALDTVMTTVSAEADRRARENASKTAEALDSVARWIERAEDRMSESTRIVTEGARMAMERQDRTANVLGEALGLMTRRLDEIERKVVDGQQPSVVAALKAVEKVEQHLASLDEAQRSKPQDAQIQTALRGFEERIAAITEKLADTAPRGLGRRGLSITDEVKEAVAEIRSRQSHLDGNAVQRSHDDILKSLRGDIAKLAGQLETIKPDREQESRILGDLRHDIDGLQDKLGGLATRDEISTLEQTLSELTQEAVRAADAGRSEELASITKVIARVESELSGLSEIVAGGVHERMAKDYESLSAKIDAMSEASIDPKAAKGMMRELEAIRAVFSELADPDRVHDLSDQVRELSRQVGQMARSQVDAIEFATLRSAVEDIRGAVKASRTSQANADQMVDQFAQLTRKLDELPDRIPQADLNTLSTQYESVAQKIADLASEQPRQEMAKLSDRVEHMALKLEEMSGRLTRPQAQLMASEIAAMSSDLTRLPQQDWSAIESINQQFAALTAKVDSLVDRPVVADLGPVSRQIEALEKRLADSWIAKDGAQFDAPEILGRLDALTSKIDRFQSEPKDVYGHDFKKEFGQLQRNLENVLITSQAATPVGFETLIERFDRLDAKLRQPKERDDLKPLEDMLSQLAAKLDAAERPNAGLDTVDALEGQIGEIIKRLERSENGDPALSSLERSMSDLMSQIEVMRDGAVEAAERAARAAIADTLGALPKDDGRGAEDLDFLTRSLVDLKTSQTEAAKRSIDTMGSVQDTLDKLVERLAVLEDKGRQQALPTMPRAAAPRLDGKKSFDFEGGPRPKRNPEAGTVKKQPDRSPVKSLEDAARAHMATAGEQSFFDADKPIAATGTLGNDVLLEPGSGRPNLNPARTESEAVDDASDIKASFIAAARRAAQSAAAEAAASVGDGKGANAREPLLRHAADSPGFTGRMRHAITTKRRPLLMGVAAVLLAMGAFQISARFIIDNGDTNTLAVGETSQVEQRAELDLPTPSPLLEPIGGLNETPGPETTASIDINSLLSDGSSGLSAPGETLRVIGADEFIVDREQKNEAGGILLPPRREAARNAVPEDQVPEHRLFPSIVSADELPDSAGPKRLRDAVLAGDIRAVYELASRAADGRGIARDNNLAAKLFERAAAHGLVPAQFRIGNHYEKGLGVTRDFALASLWYQRAAESGNSRAMHNLAVLLAEGVGGAPDYEGAVGWFSRAAEYGVRDSQYNLAVLLARGLGSKQDLAGSYTWFAIAATQGDTDAASKRDEVAGRLSESELALAKAKVELWRPKAPTADANDVRIPAHGWNDAPGGQASLLRGRG